MGLIRDDLSRQVIGAAIGVHKALGPGLFEAVYHAALIEELRRRSTPFTSELPLEVNYKGVNLGIGYRMDLLINDEIVVELKAVDKVLPIHEAQLMTYMKLAKARIGYIINFNVHLLKQGITRRVL
jgi:GxxExxY protein